MVWKGFITESKEYMNYPRGDRGRFAEWNCIDVCEDGWTVEERRAAKLKFWKAFPRAFIHFYWSVFCYKIRKRRANKAFERTQSPQTPIEN